MKNSNLKQDIKELKAAIKVLEQYADRYNTNGTMHDGVIIERMKSDLDFKEIMLSLQTILKGE